MKRYNWYEVKYNAEGEVILVTLAQKALDNATGDAKAQGNEYVHRIDWVEGSVNAKDTVLFENSRFDGETPTISTTAQINTDGPSMKGNTFYVNTTDKTGFNVMDDVKVVFIQKNDNKTTTTWESGSKELEDFVGDLNKNANGKYDYEVSAILEGGRATTVVLRDLNGTGDGGKTPTSKVTGAKAAITGAPDTLTGGSTVDEIKIGYLTEKDAPKDVNDIQAVIEDWAKENNYTLGARTAIAGSGYSWECFDRYGTKQGAVKVVTANMTQGVRVNYADDSTKGYEIKALDIDSTTGAAAVSPKTNDAFNAKESAKYVKYNDGNGDKWSTKGGNIAVTGHDWKVYTGVDAKVTIDGSTYYGNEASMNIVGDAAAVAAGTAAVNASTLKSGTTIESNDASHKHETYSAAASVKIADDKVYNSGYIKIDATGVSGVSIGNEAVTADTDYYVPAGSTVAIEMTDTSGKHYQASDADGSIGNVLTTSATAHTLTITVNAKNVTVGEVKKLTLPTGVADVGTTGLTLAWKLNGQSVSGDVYMSSADKLVATVTFGKAFDDANTTGDTITAAATGATIKGILSNAVGTAATPAASVAVTLVTDEIPAGSTIEFEFTGTLTANPTITYAAK